MMDILMGLLAAILWGATDFLIGVNTRAVGVKVSVFCGQFLGLVVMLLILSFIEDQWRILVSSSAGALVGGLLASVCTLAGALALSKAFSIGKTAIVAPVVTSYGVFTTFLAWSSGDKISAWQLFGILICFLGVLLASRRATDLSSEKGSGHAKSIKYALLAALLYGSSFWFQGKFALPELGPVNMLALTYTIGVIFLTPGILRQSRNLKSLTPWTIGTLCGASIFNLGAFYAFSLGVLNGSLSIVTVISTLSGGIAAILGYVFYKERLIVVQVLGIVLVLIGAAMLHLFG